MAKRRPSGDGMVRLKKENQWEGRIVVGHKQNGDAIFRYAYGKTQKEMMQKLNALKLQYQDADLNEDSNITLSEWLDKWIKELMPQAVRPNTLKGFELICRCYIKPYLGDKKIAFITTNDVQKMYAKLKKEGRINKHPIHGHKLTDNMIIKIHSTLHLAMETAIANNLIVKNPTEGTTVPKKKKKELKVLNDSVMEGQQKFDTHVDKLTNYIRFWQSSGESAKTSIRVRKKRGQMVEDGLYAGGYVPYGYKVVKNGRTNHKNREVYDLEIDSYESDVVKLIFQLAYENFWGARKISNELARRCIKNKKGKLFGQSTINSILDNISYTGVLKSGETVSKIHPHLQIITPSVFEFVQKLRCERSSKDKETKEKSSMSCNDISDVPTFGKGLVSGIIHCDCCGAKLRTKSTRLNGHKPISEDNPRIPTYVCENRLYEGKKEKICISDDVQTQYRAYKIDNVIDEMIKQLLRRTKALQSGEFVNYKYQTEWKRIQGSLNHAKTLYKKKQNEIRSIENKIVSASQFDEVVKELTEILKRLKNEAEPLLEQVQKCETDFAELQKNCYEIEQEYNNIIKWADIYENANLQTKQIIVAHLIDSISVKKGYELTVNFKINLEQFENGLEFQAVSSY